MARGRRTSFRRLWRSARDNFGALVIQQSFLDVSESLFGSYDRLVPGTPTRLVARLNERVAQTPPRRTGCCCSTCRGQARARASTRGSTSRAGSRARSRLRRRRRRTYGELVARVVAAQRGQSRKCLVLDLDNTLWGGVIGDDGLEGNSAGRGQRSRRGSSGLAALRQVSSRSEESSSPCAPRTSWRWRKLHFAIIRRWSLRRSDIAAFVANWNDKAQNLRAIAQQLNIGLDSLVFVDDNPVERARVRESLPMVAVPELPADAAHYVRCIADAGYFEAVSFTDEDRDRAGQYAANAEREALRGTSHGHRSLSAWTGHDRWSSGLSQRSTSHGSPSSSTRRINST